MATIKNSMVDAWRLKFAENSAKHLLEILESLFDRDKSLLSYEDLETYYEIAKSLGRTYRLLEVANELESRLEPKKPFAGLWDIVEGENGVYCFV